ncbi:MAG: ABC transporter permease [Candidatus Nanopelagicales bacterium]
MRRVRFTAVTVLLIAIAAVVVLASLVSSGNFLSASTLSALTPLLAIMVVVSLGQGIVIGTGGIDLSLPATMTLAGTIVLKMSGAEPDRLITAIVVALLCCALVGVLNGVLIEVFGLNALVVTLAVGLLVGGLTRLYRGPVLAITSVPDLLQTWARANVAGFSVLLVLAFAGVALLSFLVRRSVRGRRLVASSAAPRAAFLMGLWSSSYRVLAFAVAGFLYGVGAIMLAGLLGSPDLTLGNAYLLEPIVAVVLGGAALSGGRVSFLATALGALFITLLDFELKVAGYGSGVSLVVQGLVLAIGLSAINLARRRAASSTGGQRRPAPQALGVT